jgi:hypothetical protein
VEEGACNVLVGASLLDVLGLDAVRRRRQLTLKLGELLVRLRVRVRVRGRGRGGGRGRVG